MSAETSAPTPSTRLLFGLLAARAAFGLTYLIGSLRRSPIPWYYPLERRWAFESAPVGLGMEWFGRTGSALLFAGVAFAIAWIASARGTGLLARALARPSMVVGVARAVGLMMLVDFTYFGWILLHQTPKPIPLPNGFPGF